MPEEGEACWRRDAQRTGRRSAVAVRPASPARGASAAPAGARHTRLPRHVRPARSGGAARRSGAGAVSARWTLRITRRASRGVHRAAPRVSPAGPALSAAAGGPCRSSRPSPRVVKVTCRNACNVAPRGCGVSVRCDGRDRAALCPGQHCPCAGRCGTGPVLAVLAPLPDLAPSAAPCFLLAR